MADIIPFDFDGDAVRVVVQSGEPWFVAKDVCDVLEIGNSRDAVARLDEDELMSVIATSGGQRREMNAVSESGLYSLIFRSRKPEARRFRKWVTGEVLPSLRKHGRYGGGPALPALPSPALSLKPGIRVQVMHSAVQVAKMQDGDEADVDRLFEKYCSMVAARREDAVRARGFEGFELWADSYLTATTDTKERIQASVLYDRYRHWCRETGEHSAMSMKAWGNLMRKRFDHIKSGVFWYFVKTEPSEN